MLEKEPEVEEPEARQSNQAGIEMRRAKAVYVNLERRQSNQAGIEMRWAVWASGAGGNTRQSNQAGIEIEVRAVDPFTRTMAPIEPSWD